MVDDENVHDVDDDDDNDGDHHHDVMMTSGPIQTC